jgi:Baseplate J-like protein
VSGLDLRVGRCGCCRPLAPATPEPIVNRPALAAVAYRTGTYASFRQSAIDLIPALAERLAVEEGLAVRPLELWTSRQSDDYGIALVEMWATIADILTFYQERYANRAWLRTALDHDAVRRLAGLLGYRLKPGVAARTHLAITLEDGAVLTVPAGLRAQSVPGDGQRPQKFATDTTLEATSALNRVPVYGAPRPVSPLAAGRTRETLGPTSGVPLPGDPVVLCTDGADGVEERAVAAVEVVDDRSVVAWSRPLERSHALAFVRTRTHRAFGHSAPATYLEQSVATGGPVIEGPSGTDLPFPRGSVTRLSPQSSSSNFVSWTQRATDYQLDTATVHLDGTVEGIEAGSQVLVVAGGVAHLRTVQAAVPATAEVGPLTGGVTALELDAAVAHDVRTTVVHELAYELRLQDWELPDSPLPPGTTAVFVAYPAVGAVQDGRVLVLDDDAGQPLLTAADGDGVPDGIGDEAEFLRVELADATTRELDHRSAHLLGNLVPASHGERVAAEVLGDGNTAATLQRFGLAKSPVTHVADPTAPGGAGNSLEVFVDGVRWWEVPSLYGHAPGEFLYVTAIDDNATMTIRFGDGQTGARLPTGRANVVASYRQGLGVDGNLDAGQVATALDRPVGLMELRNPLASSGGVDPETTDGARENAPNTVRTFDRAVSLRDFADLAREFTGVAKSLATWVWDGEERVVHVTVGGEGGAPLASILTDLRAYLDLRRDPNRTLRLGEFRPVPFVVGLAVEAEAERFNDDVTVAVTEAVQRYFTYDDRAFGQAVHLSDLYQVVHTVDGVVSALATELDYKTAGDRATHPSPLAPGRRPAGGRRPRPPAVLLHAPIAGARHEPATGAILPAELAVLEAGDLTVTTSGGLVR